MHKLLDQLLSQLAHFVSQSETLKRKITVTFLSVGHIPLLLISIISIVLTTSMSNKLVKQNLDSLKANKQVAIEAFGKQITDQIITSSNDPNLAINLQIINSGFESLLSEIAEPEEISSVINQQKSELSTYYNQAFLAQYKSSNDGASVDTNNLLNNLSDRAIALQYA